MPDFQTLATSQQNAQEARTVSSFYNDLDISSGGIDPDDWKFVDYRDRTGNDLPADLQAKHTATVAYLYQSNPIAHRYIEVLKAFTMGDGPVPIASNTGLQELLDEYWYNPHNRWQVRSIDYAADLAIYGEQAYMFGNLYERDANPKILGVQYIDPADIRAVIPSSLDKYTPNEMWLNKRVFPGITRQDDARLKKKIVQLSRETRNLLEGDVFYAKINNVGGAARGLSDLFPLADWMQLYNNYQFSMGERLTHLSTYFFDVVMEGVDEGELLKLREQLLLQPMKPGTFIVHNDRAQLKPVTIDLQGNQLTEVGNGFFNVITTGLGVPAHWTGQGGDGGRSIAEAAADPVFRFFSSRQTYMKEFLSDMIRMQVQIESDGPKISPKDEFKLVFPRLGMRDLQRSGGAAARIVQALRDSVEFGILDRSIASTLLLSLFEEIGLKKPDTDMSPKEALPLADPNVMADSKESMQLLESIEGAVDEHIEGRTLGTDEEKALATRDWYQLLAFSLA